VEEFAQKLSELDAEIAFQDESLTSVLAEERLKKHGRPYSKGDIDAQAAAIILQDYLEERYG
jgi:putative transcription antitermination factor YqgF